MRKILMVGLLLSGCAGIPVNEQTVGAYPADFMEVMSRYVRDSFIEPDSIRDASISKPFPGTILGQPAGWLVCMRANSKNQLGGYTGPQLRSYLIHEGEVLGSLPNHVDCQGVALQAWPEIEQNH